MKSIILLLTFILPNLVFAHTPSLPFECEASNNVRKIIIKGNYEKSTGYPLTTSLAIYIDEVIYFISQKNITEYKNFKSVEGHSFYIQAKDNSGHVFFELNIENRIGTLNLDFQSVVFKQAPTNCTFKNSIL